MLIKICGVRDPNTALFAAKNGAHFIGMVLSEGFRRSVTINLAKQIVKAAREGGAVPVGVFVSDDPDHVAAVCHILEIDTVQYYQSEALLPPHLKRIYVNNLDAHLRNGDDFLLLEGKKPGSGEKIDEKSLHLAKGKKFILAGGLHPGNIQEMINLYQPIGVDVSSGVEEQGKKSCELIQKFIEKVRAYA